MRELLTEQEEEMLKHMMMSEDEIDLRGAAQYYRSIPIPERLQDMVAETIERHAKKEGEQRGKKRRKKSIVVTLRTVGALAAAVVLFMIPLNVSEAFAKQMQDIPVLGAFAKVLTLRSYSYTENDVNVNIQVPEITISDAGEGADISGGSDVAAGGAEDEPENNGASDAEWIADVNAEILQIVEGYEAAAKQRFEEYKEAFFATGGTEEEWGGRTCDVDVEYTVTYQEGTRLSLVLTTTESWAAVYAQRYYYNLDVQTGKTLTLEDMLGTDWKEICNESIVDEIERRIAEEEDMMYWGFTQGDEYIDDIEGFQSVSEQTSFYINERGNVVVCFDKYEIAPGYMGMQEFEIMDAD